MRKTNIKSPLFFHPLPGTSLCYCQILSPHWAAQKGTGVVWLERSSFTPLLCYSGVGSSYWVSFFRRKICSHVRSPWVSSSLGNIQVLLSADLQRLERFSPLCALPRDYQLQQSPSQSKGEYPLPLRFCCKLQLPLFIFWHWCSQNSFLLLCSLLFCLYGLFWSFLKMFFLRFRDLGWGAQPYLRWLSRGQLELALAIPGQRSSSYPWQPQHTCKPNTVVFLILLIINFPSNEHEE